MQPAHAADIADRLHDWHLRSCWPPSRKSPALGGTSNRAELETSSATKNTAIDLTVQRAFDGAMRRAARIDRTAYLLLSIGRVDAAERLSHAAAAIRAVAA